MINFHVECPACEHRWITKEDENIYLGCNIAWVTCPDCGVVIRIRIVCQSTVEEEKLLPIEITT